MCSQKSFVEATEKRKTAPDRVIFKFFFSLFFLAIARSWKNFPSRSPMIVTFPLSNCEASRRNRSAPKPGRVIRMSINLLFMLEPSSEAFSRLTQPRSWKVFRQLLLETGPRAFKLNAIISSSPVSSRSCCVSHIFLNLSLNENHSAHKFPMMLVYRYA